MIIQDGNIVVGVLLANGDLDVNAYHDVAGGIDDAGVQQILKEWRAGRNSGELCEFTWREEVNRD
jgi:hypothetical protein